MKCKFNLHLAAQLITQKNMSPSLEKTASVTEGKELPLSLVERIARPNILSLVPYRCARDDYSVGVLLDANENSFGPPLSSPDQQKLSRYPCPHQHSLKQKFASLRSLQTSCVIKEEFIFCGVGSDEAIDLLMRIFCTPSTQDSILITPPTYGMYSVCAKINDLGIIKVPLTPDFDVQTEEVSFLSQVTPNLHPSLCISEPVLAFFLVSLFIRS
jgi:histidinol-phosphate aminotransferase